MRSATVDAAAAPDAPVLSGVRSSPVPTPAATTLGYDVSVIMNPDATVAQCADVVFAMTQQLQNARVSLELSLPAGDGHAESVVDYRNAFDTPVARTTVDSVSHAIDVAASVPGVKSVHMVVPYTWNLASGAFDVVMTTDDSRQTTALRDALSRTALAGVAWSGSGATASSAPRSTGSPSTTQLPTPTAAPTGTHSPAATHSPRPKPSPTPSLVPSPSESPTPSAN